MNYTIYEKIGDINYRPTTTMSFEEFNDHIDRQIIKNYWKERSVGLDGESAVSGRQLIPKLFIIRPDSKTGRKIINLLFNFRSHLRCRDRKRDRVIRDCWIAMTMSWWWVKRISPHLRGHVTNSSGASRHRCGLRIGIPKNHGRHKCLGSLNMIHGITLVERRLTSACSSRARNSVETPPEW